MEERTGNCYALSLSLKSKKLLKKSLRQGKNYLVSSDNTCGDVLKLCVIIHHYQPLSKLS